jgi:hypothetical protein
MSGMSEAVTFGDLFSHENPVIKDFLNIFNAYVKDIGGTEKMASHDVPVTVRISCMNNDKMYVLTGMSMDRFTCGCESGITLEIKEEE